jgi:hypothetical protein
LQKFGGIIEYIEGITKAENERNTLLQHKEQLLKKRKELEVLLEHVTLTGDYSPTDTEVLPFR